MAGYSVDEILKTVFDSNDSNMWNPSEKMQLVTKEIEHLKLDMKIFLSESDYNVPELINESRQLCNEVEHTLSEMHDCKKEIEDVTLAEIVKSIESHDLIAKELETVMFSLNIVYDIVQCGKYLKDFEDCKKEEKYLRAVEALKDLRDFLDSSVEGYNQMTMHANLKSLTTVQWDETIVILSKKWDELFYWITEEKDHTTTITIYMKFEADYQTNDIMQALIICNQLPVKLSKFSKFLLNKILKPIMLQDCTVFAETDEKMIITIPQKTQTKPPYDAVVANIRILLHFLSNKFNLNYITNSRTMMTMVGQEIYKDFTELLTKECLIDTIPNSINELQSYGRITAEIEDFQRFMIMVKFLPDESFSILKYTDNIDVLFASKCRVHFLQTAREIMLKDLSVTMSIGVKDVPNELDAEQLDMSVEEVLRSIYEYIPMSLFFFPRCMISKTTQELLDLVYVMMEQAVQCSDLVCKRLYTATRYVFELYEAVVPYYHENFLQTIPQYVALFHNNCMYLAHNLLTLGEKWVMLMEGRRVTFAINFVDLVQKLRDLGHKHLIVHMQQQRKQILDNIRSSDLNCIVVKDVLGDNAEQAIRQCLRQLQLLKNVWIGVLPTNVFRGLMGTLINLFFDELIHRVCTVEDISAEMASQLTEMYTMVVNKAPNLFQDDDMRFYVPLWRKMEELVIILGSSLKEIEIRWCEGNGPLAREFRTEELRNLIKALFQNTQFRSNLLSKIK